MCDRLVDSVKRDLFAGPVSRNDSESFRVILSVVVTRGVGDISEKRKPYGAVPEREKVRRVVDTWPRGLFAIPVGWIIRVCGGREVEKSKDRSDAEYARRPKGIPDGSVLGRGI